MNYSELKLESQVEQVEVKISDTITLQVFTYLPIARKAKFLEYITVNAINDQNGCFSPLSVELYFALAVCHFYAGIQFDKGSPTDVYDALESNNIINIIMKAIPKDEIDFMKEITEETISDMSRFNSSAAGIIQAISANATDLDTQLSDVLGKVKNAEGLELLSEIKNINGTPPEEKEKEKEKKKEKRIVVKKG